MSDKQKSLFESAMQTWKPVLENENIPEIQDQYRKKVTALVLENTRKFLNESTSSVAANVSGVSGAAVAGGDGPNIKNWDPVLISLVRRSTPNLLAFDIAGVQPMTGPTGLIFTLRSRYQSGATTAYGGTGGSMIDPANAEALFNEADTGFSGDGVNMSAVVTLALGDTTGVSVGDTIDISGDLPAGYGDLNGLEVLANGGVSTGGIAFVTVPGTTNLRVSIDAAGNIADTIDLKVYNVGRAMSTVTGEKLGVDGGSTWNEMGFTIERTSVTADTRGMKAEYTNELAQDLRAIHGLDAESELANILTTEVMAEQNREMVRIVNRAAKLGGKLNSGLYDVQENFGSNDFDGRWFAERWKKLIYQIEIEANKIAKDTRRGRGNFIICSSDIASALSMAGVLDHAPAIQASLNVDDTGNLFAGVLNGKYKVYIDPYAEVNYINVGYRGASQYDAGVYYAPYVPLEMVRAVGEDSFQPKIGFKTRYGIVANPFATIGANNKVGDQSGLSNNQNFYYRKFVVANLY